MGVTTEKGELAEGMVIADLLRRGYGIALPMGHAQPFDLVLIRDHASLERVQVKHAVIKDGIIRCKCRSSSAWVDFRYTKDHVDWIAIYEATEGRCYYIPAEMLGEGRTAIWLRHSKTEHGAKSQHLSSDFLEI